MEHQEMMDLLKQIQELFEGTKTELRKLGLIK